MFVLLRLRRIKAVFRPLPAVLCLLLPALQPSIPSTFSDIPSPSIQLDPKLLDIKPAQKPKSDKYRFTLLPVGFQRNPQVDYVILTEMTPAGKKLPPPTFDKPAYYLSHSMGQNDVGDAYGGTKEIKYKFLEKTLTDALASNGYRPCDDAHPPSIVLILYWGMHNRIEPLLQEDGTDETYLMPVSYTINIDDVRNLSSRAKTIGGRKFADEFTQALRDQISAAGNSLAEPNNFSLDGCYGVNVVVHYIRKPDAPSGIGGAIKSKVLCFETGPLVNFADRDETTASLVDNVFNESYYLIVTAYDADALKRQHKKLLWTTRISTNSRGISFERTLPIMINTGAYYFGRETNGPEIILKRAYKNATVELGEMTVVDDTTSGSASPSPTGTTAPKPAPAPSGTTTGKP